MRITLILTLCTLFFMNCRNECENDNVKLGDVSLADETSQFLEYYSDRSTIIYENTFGNTRQHDISLSDSLHSQLCVTVLCRPDFEVGGLNGCEFYDADFRQFTLSHDDLILELKAGVEMYIPETELFYDYIDISLSANVDTFSAGLITHSSFTSPTILDTAATIQTAKMIFMQNDTLGGFENVWVYQLENDSIDTYFILEQSRGIVQYKYDDEIWTLVD